MRGTIMLPDVLKQRARASGNELQADPLFAFDNAWDGEVPGGDLSNGHDPYLYDVGDDGSFAMMERLGAPRALTFEVVP